MSDTASTRATRNTPDHRPLAAAPDLLSSLAPLLAEWVPRQRWFAGKGRLITGFTLLSATELLPCTDGSAPGLLLLLVRAQQSAPPSRTPVGGDCYQLLLGVHPALPPQLAPAVIGRPGGGPLHGRTVYDALLDNRLCGLLLERLRVPGRLGALRFCREPDAEIPSGLPGRPIAVEQSNSSIVYGDSFILKVFRRIEPGSIRIWSCRGRCRTPSARGCPRPPPGTSRRPPRRAARRRRWACCSRSCRARRTAGSWR